MFTYIIFSYMNIKHVYIGYQLTFRYIILYYTTQINFLLQNKNT